MDPQQFALQYLLINADKFKTADMFHLRQILMDLPQAQQFCIQGIALKNPIVTLILSLLLGAFAVDRFYIGDLALGVIKIILVFCVIGWIWVVLDWFLTYQKTKQINFCKILLAV